MILLRAGSGDICKGGLKKKKGVQEGRREGGQKEVILRPSAADLS